MSLLTSISISYEITLCFLKPCYFEASTKGYPIFLWNSKSELLSPLWQKPCIRQPYFLAKIWVLKENSRRSLLVDTLLHHNTILSLDLTIKIIQLLLVPFWVPLNGLCRLVQYKILPYIKCFLLNFLEFLHILFSFALLVCLFEV